MQGLWRGQIFDAVIALSAPPAAERLKRLAPRAIHICWLHLTPDQSAMAPLAAMTPYIDCAVFVSKTQRAMISLWRRLCGDRQRHRAGI